MERARDGDWRVWGKAHQWRISTRDRFRSPDWRRREKDTLPLNVHSHKLYVYIYCVCEYNIYIDIIAKIMYRKHNKTHVIRTELNSIKNKMRTVAKLHTLKPRKLLRKFSNIGAISSNQITFLCTSCVRCDIIVHCSTIETHSFFIWKSTRTH